jgi:hypothetical protein
MANYGKTKAFMLIEEKRFGGSLSTTQRSVFSLLHTLLSSTDSPAYKGFYIVRFSQTSPDDGDIYVEKYQAPESDGSFGIKSTAMTRDEFVSFLRFEHWIVEA